MCGGNWVILVPLLVGVRVHQPSRSHLPYLIDRHLPMSGKYPNFNLLRYERPSPRYPRQCHFSIHTLFLTSQVQVIVVSVLLCYCLLCLSLLYLLLLLLLFFFLLLFLLLFVVVVVVVLLEVPLRVPQRVEKLKCGRATWRSHLLVHSSRDSHRLKNVQPHTTRICKVFTSFYSYSRCTNATHETDVCQV